MSLLGLALSLGALACEAAFSLLAAPLLTSLGPRAVSTYACLFAAPMLLAVGLLLDGAAVLALPSLGEGAALGHLAAMVTAAGFVLWYSGVDRLGVERAGLFAGILPASALLSAAALGSSEISLSVWWGRSSSGPG
jgi:drug/metabolite transporter (DMT)-like permease